MRLALVLAALLLASAPASAVTVLLHSTSGRECYLQTMSEATPENNKKALAICNQAVDDAQADTDTYNKAAALVNRADVRLRMEDYSGVIADSMKAIAVYDSLAPAYLNLGAGMIGLKRYDEALSLLDKAINLNGSEPELAYFDRALAKENLGDVRGAYYDYRKAVELNPKFQPAADELTRFKVTSTPS